MSFCAVWSVFTAQSTVPSGAWSEPAAAATRCVSSVRPSSVIPRSRIAAIWSAAVSTNVKSWPACASCAP